MPSTPEAQAARERARRAAYRAEREATTLEMLSDRLPDYEPRASFPGLWADVKHLRGILPRDSFYDLLTSLDGSHLNEDLIIRIRHHDRASRRAVLIRPRRPWEDQRHYLDRYLRRGRLRPPQPVGYKTAHDRIRAERGPASSYSCDGCGERAAEWAYAGFSPDEQTGVVASADENGVVNKTLRIWSPSPYDYIPLCARCHLEFDESGVVWPEPPPRRRRPATPSAPLPPDAPTWVRALPATSDVPAADAPEHLPVDAPDWLRRAVVTGEPREPSAFRPADVLGFTPAALTPQVREVLTRALPRRPAN